MATEVDREELTQEVIERLRQSKRKGDDARKAEGREAGRQWAMEVAEARDLEMLASYLEQLDGNRELWYFFTSVPDNSVYVPAESIAFELLPEGSRRDDCHEFWEQAMGDGYEKLMNDLPYLEGFVRGAVELWEEVKDKL